ncbi:MBL fold metallo-hydrolase [Bowmanella dokdonensis]
MNNQLAAIGAEQAKTNSHFYEGKFHNAEAVTPTSLGRTLAIMLRFFTEEKVHAVPEQALPIQTISRVQLLALSDNELHLVKLGHSSVLLKVYKEFWLIDPVFAERASPFAFIGPKRFHQTPISIEELPNIDKVLISHNHYDHLDKAAVKQLSRKTGQFLVPLGVEADLIKWGLPEDKILSFDWWQEMHTDQGLIAFTPTRHFSGRGLSDANNSLWGSWVIKTAHQNVFFSGDSGYFQGFKQIGRKYGPFDLTLVETGAYDPDWPDVHMTPEQSLQAHLDLQGRVMMPIHNGTFDLAFHAWYEPLERISQLADQHNVRLSSPVPGQVLSLQQSLDTLRWWQPLIPSLQTAGGK